MKKAREKGKNDVADAMAVFKWLYYLFLYTAWKMCFVFLSGIGVNTYSAHYNFKKGSFLKRNGLEYLSYSSISGKAKALL